MIFKGLGGLICLKRFRGRGVVREKRCIGRWGLVHGNLFNDGGLIQEACLRLGA